MTDECIRRIEEIAFSTIETSGEMRRMEVTEKQSSEIFLSCLYSARRSDGRKFFNHPQYLYVGLKNILIFCICRNIHYTTILHLTILIFQICRMLIKLKSCLLMQYSCRIKKIDMFNLPECAPMLEFRLYQSIVISSCRNIKSVCLIC